MKLRPTLPMSEAFTSAWLGLQCQMIPGAVQGMAALDISADGAVRAASLVARGMHQR